MDKVYQIKRAREARQLRPQGLAPLVAWPLNELKPGLPDEWIMEAVCDSDVEGVARSIWAHFPNLKLATQRLALYITPKWPTQDGKSLLAQTVQRAARKTQVAIERGDSTGQIVGVYLGWLTACVDDIARLSVYGIDKSGEAVKWAFFTVPLLQWAESNGMNEVVAHLVQPEPDLLAVRGLRTHLIAHIAHHVDAGLIEKYLPTHLIIPEEI